jgi:hypothetical protein
MTWTSFHRRGDVLRRVIAAADARRDGVLPLDVDGATVVFTDERDLLGALQLTWITRLMGRIERHQTDEPANLEAAVIAAWHDTYDELPGVRAILDRCREHPDEAVRVAMAKATNKERLTLAVASGLGNPDDEASLAVGTRVEDRARASHLALDRRTTDEPAVRVGFLDRLKAALAA